MLLLLAVLWCSTLPTLATLSPNVKEAVPTTLEEVRDQDSTNCPDTWLDASFLDMGCLLINSSKAYHWDAANIYCQRDENATLVEIVSEAQLGFLRMKLTEQMTGHQGNKNCWTSGTDAGRNGVWRWV